jgi:hypothetical protein
MSKDECRHPRCSVRETEPCERCGTPVRLDMFYRAGESRKWTSVREHHWSQTTCSVKWQEHDRDECDAARRASIPAAAGAAPDEEETT